MNFELKPFIYKNREGTFSISLKNTVSIKPHGCYLVMGPSGVGKSTFLKILKGFYPEFLDGAITSNINIFSDSFYLFQNPYTQLIQRSPLLEFLFSMENKEFPKQKMAKNLTLIEHFGLLELLERKDTRHLSHGECQKLLLVSLLLAEPDWVFLDEPTAFVDPNARKEMYQLIKKEKDHRGFLIVDHHIDEIKNICDGVFELRFSSEGNDVNIAYNNTSNLDIREIKNNISNFDIQVFDNCLVESRCEILFENYTSYYQKNIPLFNPINLQIKKATVTTIVGRSGVGKSTLLKSILGEHKDVSGSVLLKINDVEISRKNRFNHIAYLFQNPEVHFFYDTVEEELKMAGTWGHEIEKLLGLFRLKTCLEQNPFLLSEGQKRRLSFLLVLLQKKEFLLLDEPTFGQDLEQIEIITECIRILKSRGITILMVSHDPGFYSQLSDQVLFLERENR